MSDKIPFRVSARTARLIGRENVATAKGAIIELVKNGYDADSPFCLILFDNKYGVFHDSLNSADYNHLLSLGVDSALLSTVYFNNDGQYRKRTDVDNDKIGQLKSILKGYSVLYIVDAGEGMTGEIIRNNWMTIGTENKATNYVSKEGRVKVGAKGIGRFALDKLGEQCEMLTFYDSNVHVDMNENGEASNYIGYRWMVNWNDFEGANKTIDSIGAELEGISEHPFTYYLNNIPLTTCLKKLVSKKPIKHGTILKITHLRDIWDDDAVEKVFDDLSVLVPPTENHEFNICLSSLDKPNKYGEVESSLCDDYDYKLVAHADDYQNVSIRIYRKEYITEAIPKTFFLRENQKKYPYRLEDFIQGYWETKRTFAQLIPGFKDADTDGILNRIGSFDFSFYYLKRSATRKDEARFFYRQCPYNLRKDWLDKYGGIKLFRDSFRVRPYGEKSDTAFDWLGLGARKNNNPAGVAKKEGGYRVEAENVAGSILISRTSNIDFEDKSSREGLQENKTFIIFKQIIISIIKLFEDDRSQIARELVADDEDRNGATRDKERAEELANKIIANRHDATSTDRSNMSAEPIDNSSSDYQLQLLANVYEQKNEEIKQLREEQRVLRALASSGLMLASFAHDLSKLNDSIDYRYDKIVSLLNQKVKVGDFPDERRRNPFYLLNQAKHDDLKMQSWLSFSTNIIKKDKRRRKNVVLNTYLGRLRDIWSGIFMERGIQFSFTCDDTVIMRVFEIDFDSIFYNLISNSIEAFIRSKIDRERRIEVIIEITEKTIMCTYRDNGPGLSLDIVNPYDIFQPLFTTKRNASTGEEIGTGLGMWLVKLIAEDNDARVILLSPAVGFGIQLLFPIKYERK